MIKLSVNARDDIHAFLSLMLKNNVSIFHRGQPLSEIDISDDLLPLLSILRNALKNLENCNWYHLLSFNSSFMRITV